MPEYPDVAIYLERIESMFRGVVLQRVRLRSPFVLRTVEPPISALEGRPLELCERLGKRLVLGFSGDLFLVVHLMIAGRFRLKAPGAPIPGKVGVAAFDFEPGTLILTEASSKKRASLHVVEGRAGLAAHDRGGVDPLAVDVPAFGAALVRENRTLKRALTDPRILSGIGNAYSDEILFEARLSPLKRTRQLTLDEMERLHGATVTTLRAWEARLRSEVGDGFPDKVTAFRPEMAVHGRFKLPCPRCGSAVQRVRFADNELNYCPRCQTEGRLLADRSLSRLLRGDWPKTLDELEGA